MLQLAELPTPEPGPGEVLIRVTRAGVNFADTHQRHNQYVAKYDLPMIPGAEVAGVREDIGERVVAICGTGGYAEYVAVPEGRCALIPDGVDDGTAVALMIQGLTAWHLYRSVGHVAQGESVAIIAAAGGVGSLACQLGHPMGAGRVIAVASTEEKRRLAVELGADTAVAAEPEGLGERLIEANGGRPIDVVFEMAGGQVFEECFEALAPFGRICAYGIASRDRNSIDSGALLKHSRTVAGFWLMHCLDRPEMLAGPLRDLFERAARGEVRSVAGDPFPLERAAEAQIALAERRTVGKMLIDPTA